MVKVKKFPLEELQSPMRVLATVLNDHGSSFLGTVDPQNDKWGHSIKEATVIDLKISLFQMKFKLAEHTAYHHGGRLHDWGLNKDIWLVHRLHHTTTDDSLRLVL